MMSNLTVNCTSSFLSAEGEAAGPIILVRAPGPGAAMGGTAEGTRSPVVVAFPNSLDTTELAVFFPPI